MFCFLIECDVKYSKWDSSYFKMQQLVFKIQFEMQQFVFEIQQVYCSLAHQAHLLSHTALFILQANLVSHTNGRQGSKEAKGSLFSSGYIGGVVTLIFCSPI